MLFYKPDYLNGGFVILEILKSRNIKNIIVVNKWKIIFQYGNTKDINFMLNEKISKDDCIFVRQENCYDSLEKMVDFIKTEVDNFVDRAKNYKEDERFVIQEAKEQLTLAIKDCEDRIKRFDKQIRDFSNLDVERELEKRGLIV